MKQLEPSEIKQRIFEILCAFADYCDQNGLRYYLCGGTLLGAIRHQDFIPWDDDVDVMMPRPDYDKLHELLKAQPMKQHYQLIGYTAGRGNWPFAKLVDLQTHVENEYSAADKWLWIDIFPMDGLPDNEAERKEMLSLAPGLKMLYTRAGARIGRGRSKVRAVLKIPAVLYLRLIGLRLVSRKIDRTARRYDFDTCEYAGDVAWSLGSREQMKKKEYLPVVDVTFRQRKFHAPACWDAYLTALYSDYMKLPPEDQRASHEYKAYLLD